MHAGDAPPPRGCVRSPAGGGHSLKEKEGQAADVKEARAPPNAFCCAPSSSLLHSGPSHRCLSSPRREKLAHSSSLLRSGPSHLCLSYLRGVKGLHRSDNALGIIHKSNGAHVRV